MHPSRLELKENTSYYLESDCFTDEPLHLVHAYLHPNYRIKMHSHQFYEINLIVGGEGRHYIGDTSIPACIGDVFVIPPEIQHGYHTNGELDICHIILRADFMTRYREELAAMPCFSLLFDVEPRLRRSAWCSCNLHISPYELNRAIESTRDIIKAEAARQFAYENALTLAFIGRMGELLQKSIDENILPTEVGELLLVISYIQENLDRKLTLEMISAKANMSKSTLNRQFHKALHISPMQYVTHCRIVKAREMLATGNCFKTEIAHACGFYDVAHMNKYL